MRSPYRSFCLLVPRRVFLSAMASAVLLNSFFVRGQGTAAMGDGLSAAAIARGGSTVVQQSSVVDAVQGNPAGLAKLGTKVLDLDVVGMVANGDFHNAYNSDAKRGVFAGAVPYGAYASPLRHSPWVMAVAVTPEILMRAHWRYFDAPGTAGVTYGYQKQDTSILGLRSSIAIARPIGSRWNVGATLGVVYNENHLEAPYIFQQQPVRAGLKVLVDLTTRGYGWNGSAGAQWQLKPTLRAGLAWKSGTTIHTEGDLKGSASALFAALGVSAPASFAYHAQVLNHFPQAFSAGLLWQTRSHVAWSFEGGLTAWGQAFEQLPITLSHGTNATINSVAGSSTLHDAVPLHWKNQEAFHGGLEYPLRENWTVRGGYSYRSNPVPSGTLTPLTAAIMQQSLAGGGGWAHDRWHYDLAYQFQLPSSETVRQSDLRAGEYNNSNLRIGLQSVTISVKRSF